MTKTTVDREANAGQCFAAETAHHAMEILHDDEVYRHVRFRNEADWNCWYELTTWPGHLAISGDMGAYVFSRLDDMFAFFRGRDTINPYYWSEKLVAPRGRDGATSFSPHVYQQAVRQWLDEVSEELSPEDTVELRAEVQEQLLDWADGLTTETAYDRLSRFSWKDSRGESYQIHDYWDWGLEDYDWHFLWCCWAIMIGIKRYDEVKAST